MKKRWPNDRDSGFHQFLMVRRKCLAKPRTASPVWLATLLVMMLLLMKKPQTLNLNAEAQISHHSKDTRPLSILIPALKHECTAKCGNNDEIFDYSCGLQSHCRNNRPPRSFHATVAPPRSEQGAAYTKGLEFITFYYLGNEYRVPLVKVVHVHISYIWDQRRWGPSGPLCNGGRWTYCR